MIPYAVDEYMPTIFPISHQWGVYRAYNRDTQEITFTIPDICLQTYKNGVLKLMLESAAWNSIDCKVRTNEQDMLKSLLYDRIGLYLKG